MFIIGSVRRSSVLNTSKYISEPTLKSVITQTLALRQIPKFHLISWCGNFVERHSFPRVSGFLLEFAQI